ncbi:MAG: amino acid permease [Chitinophagaceae bacterium]|nr:amino acid permease [Chitinophagaceae bacterium]
MHCFFPSHYAANNLHSSSQPIAETSNYIDWTKSLGVSLIAVSFTYGGYQQTINFGNEVDNPGKNIPRGIFIGIAIIIVLYLLVNLSYYKLIGFEQMKGEKKLLMW